MTDLVNESALARTHAGALARHYLAAMPEASLNKLVAAIATELREMHPVVVREHWTYAHSIAERAVKDRVTIGRCRYHRGKGLAFYWPRSEGPLYEAHCPECGRLLDQTSLALQVSFSRLRRR